MSFGGFLGLGEEEHAIPWQKLNYDASLGGYRTDIRSSSSTALQASIVIGITGGQTRSASAHAATRAPTEMIGFTWLPPGKPY